jgi:hypothetical protein
VRTLSESLPSPSEAGDFQQCPAAWWWRWREQVRRKESEVKRASGQGVSEGLRVFYMEPTLDPLVTYDAFMNEKLKEMVAVDEEEWGTVLALDRDVLRLYVTTKPRLEQGWKRVIASQEKIVDVVNTIPDAVVELEDGRVQPEEWKVVSPWADIEYEKAGYELGFQPLTYVVVCEKHYKRPCSSVEMKFLIRGMPAKGKWKATAPALDEHVIPVEEWKKVMVEESLGWINQWMQEVGKMIDDVAFKIKMNPPLTFMPRFTRNCFRVFGKRTIACEFWPACSVNMHPLQLAGGGFEVRK